MKSPPGVPSRSGGRKPARRLGRLAGVWPPLLVLAVWQLAATLSPTPFLVAPPPSQILRDIPRLLADGLVTDIGWTLARLVGGVGLGVSLGLLTGYGMGLSARLRRHLEPTIAMVHPTPKIALLPLFLLLLGVGEAPRVALVAFAAFFPVVINVAAGVRQVPPELLEVARAFGATRAQQWRHVILPGSLPWLLVGLRIAFSTGFVATVAAELLASQNGLGHRMWLAWEIFRPEDLYVVLGVTAGLGFSIHRTLMAIANRGLRWKPSEQRFL